MTQSILDIFRQSGDANIGQTLIRLAKLAEASHGFEQVSARKDSFLAHGRSQEALVHGRPVRDGQAGHTEVDR